MGKKSKPKAPASPDPTQIIKTQSDYNRFGTSTPFGSTSWSGGPGNFSLNTTLDPRLEGVVGDVFSRAGREGPAYTDPAARTWTAPNATLQYGAGDERYRALENAIYQDQAMQFEPAFERQNRTFENTMAARGQPQGGEAYTRDYADIADAQNRARVMAANQATIAGRGAFENDRAFNEAQNLQDFVRRESMLGADRGYNLTKYGLDADRDNQTYARLASLLALVPNANAPLLDVTTPFQMKQQGDLAKYQGQLQNYQNTMGGIMDLAGLLGQTGGLLYGGSRGWI